MRDEFLDKTTVAQTLAQSPMRRAPLLFHFVHFHSYILHFTCENFTIAVGFANLPHLHTIM